MRKLQSRLAIALLASTSLASADPQEIKFPIDFEKLAARAKETVNVALDASMLKMASGFLSDDEKDDAQVKELISKLKGVYVRSFEFDKEGQYSRADVDLMIKQLQTPDWSKIVDVKSKEGELSNIFVKRKGDQIAGLVVIAAEPKELTVVNIDGPIDPHQLSRLSGHLGIPNVGGKPKASSQKPEE